MNDRLATTLVLSLTWCQVACRGDVLDLEGDAGQDAASEEATAPLPYSINCPSGGSENVCGPPGSMGYFPVEHGTAVDSGPRAGASIEDCQCVPVAGACTRTDGDQACTCAVCGPDPADTLQCTWDVFYEVPALVVCRQR